MYQALYRKWRPQTFDEVIGQEHITETLKKQVMTGRLSHAYIFIGTRGTGKTTCARILAKAVNCEHPVNGNPCGVCAACRGIADGSVLDVVELDAASNNGVDNVRALREEAVFSPAAVKKRVYIIDEVHMLSASAFNALLKIIEEPPEHLMFILATTELQKVPATILSRCQRHSFRRIETGTLAEYVGHVAEKESLDLTREAAELIARLAEGGVRDALSLLDQCSAHSRIDVDAVYSTMGLAGKRRIEELFARIAAHDTERALEIFNKMWMDGKDPAGILTELQTLVRDTLMLRVAPKSGTELISGGHDAAELRMFAGRQTTEELTAAMETLQDALVAARAARNAKMTAELCIVTLCSSLLKNDISDFNARLSRLEEQAARGEFVSYPRSELYPEKEIETEYGADSPESEPAPPAAEPDAEEPDEPDPEQFAEEQPEEAITDRSPRETPATQSAAPADGAQLWPRLCEAILPRLPADMRIYPRDGSKLRGELRGGVLELEAESGFVFNRFNRTEILQKFSQCASELTGRAVNVIVKELSVAGRETRSLDELKKFPETKIIG